MATQHLGSGRDSVHIEGSTHGLYVSLTSGSDASFRTMKDLFMLALSLGHSQGRKAPLKSRREIFRWPVFSVQEDVPVLRSVAITETGDPAILADQDHLLTIAEEYANAGIAIIQREVVDAPGTPLDNLVRLLLL